ncbi:glucose 1-dehydrogenase [Roseomonas sp. KE2513]|uniref:glucose 1-dehydrogenase n=1 Tax=Roseomonas sp. KE2513 TaxID=2479202 RepID=UPI001E2DC003|nr:glucose 1-dehydrogenase [Roseomonas sp. KE2513]
MRLADKVAIVTGGGSGFGEGIAKRYAEEGAHVLVADINPDGGDRVAGEIAAAGAGHRVAFVRTDVTQDASMAAMVQACLERFGRLDIMVNNADTSQPNGPMLNVSEEVFDHLFAINVKSIFLSARHVVPVMRAQESGGCLVNDTSVAAIRPRAGQTWHSGVKGAASTMSKAMAAELAPERIRVNAICPVAGETPLLLPKLMPERRAAFEASIPLGRLARPRDVANAALYLASDEAEFITGVALEVDGGRAI